MNSTKPTQNTIDTIDMIYSKSRVSRETFSLYLLFYFILYCIFFKQKEDISLDTFDIQKRIDQFSIYRSLIYLVEAVE